MKIIAIKDMSAGNEVSGTAWKETKIFDSLDSIANVMNWVGTNKTNVVLTIADEDFYDDDLPF